MKHMNLLSGVVGVLGVMGVSAGAAWGQCPVTFAAPLVRTTGSGPGPVVAADFNADGWTDLAVGTSGNGGSCQLLYGNGPGTFAAPIELAGINVRALAVADLNQDGRPDLITTAFNAVRVFLRSATPTATGFAAPQLYGITNGGNGVAVADFTLDGRPDFVVETSSGLAVFAGTAGGTFTAAGSIAGLFSGGGVGLAVLDYTLDGRPDVVLLCNEAVRAYSTSAGGGGGGTVTLTPGPAWTTVWGSQCALVLDRNNDNLPDVLVGRPTSNGYNAFELRGTAQGSLVLVDVRITGPTSIALMQRADFTGDGVPELMVFEGGGTYVGETLVDTAPRGGLFAADLDRDGRMDWGGTRAAAAQVDVFLNSRPTLLRQPASVIVNPGQPCTISVGFAGSATFQWRRDGVPIAAGPGYSGHNTAALTVLNPTLADSGAIFDCVITGTGCTSVTTRAAAMMVVPPPPACGDSDFDGDGDFGTDADIESFFRVLGGGGC
jgi:hypothetical protein